MGAFKREEVVKQGDKTTTQNSQTLIIQQQGGEEEKGGWGRKTKRKCQGREKNGGATRPGSAMTKKGQSGVPEWKEKRKARPYPDGGARKRGRERRKWGKDSQGHKKDQKKSLSKKTLLVRGNQGKKTRKNTEKK